tara:strand:+ start:2901 stop:3863 length:963 start_codon:yes stop_codon:yes gene_type:complete
MGKWWWTMAFRRPRKTLHSDARSSYESVHESIFTRLDKEDVSLSSEYMCDMLPLMEKLDDLSQVEARKLFYQLAFKWMTETEAKGFAEEQSLHNDQSRSDFCEVCNESTRKWLDETGGTYICDGCGGVTKFIGASSARYLPYDHEPVPAPCPYRRSNHFNEYLDSFMARQSGSVPDEVFEEIFKELRKQRITDFSQLNQKRLRGIMKNLRLNKYYESAPFILYRIKGEKPPELTPTIEQQLKSNFDLIQEPFEKVVKQVAPERKNFLSYSYTIFKMLQLMELDHLLEYFSLLKSREKLLVQDKIWKGICNELGWRFIPSV